MKIYEYSSEKIAAAKRKAKRGWQGKWDRKKIFTYVFRLAAAGVLLSALLFLYYSKDLPDPNKLLERQVAQSTKIFARDGSLLYEIHGEYKRTLVGLDQISPHVLNATVAIEDKDFYKHKGIYLRGIMRAVYVDITHGSKAQGGSTITQQFVKNAILTRDKSWDRKIREIILAIAIDARFSKEEILKLYLNEIPYGRNAYGIEAAAQTYFNKSAKDLSIAESAYLAALPQSPTYYSPFGPHLADLEKRKNTVLQQMRAQGYINSEQEQQAKEEKVAFSSIKTSINAPHFVLWVQDYLVQKYGEKTLQEGGLKVYTTLDPKLQEIAERVVREGVEKDSKKYNANNAALVAIDPKTGQILAMVGSKDYFGISLPEGCNPGKNCLFEPNVNAAISQRQPGSSFKPYVYLTAFGKDFKYNPATPLYDLVTNFGTYGGKDYIPKNYNGASNGLLTMRKALAGSLNVPAVKTLALVGVENAVQTAHNLGITSPLQNCGLALVLGGCEVKLVDHVAAISVVANGGLKHEKTAILKIESSDGSVIEEYDDHADQIVDPQAAYELISIMTDNNARSFVFGSNSPLILPGRTVAAKTGTTQNWHDGWTIGFTPSLAAGVWAGNNDGTLLKKGADGVFVAAPIWNAFMKEALKDAPAEEFKRPAGIQEVVVDTVSGKLPSQYSTNTHAEIFADYAVPKEFDDVHIGENIDTATNLPADPLTPPERLGTRVCANYKSERPDNPNWEGPVRAWAATQPDACINGGGITSPFSPLPTGSAGVVTIDIVDPVDGATFRQTPFYVIVQPISPNPIVRVDLSIDGEFYRSITTNPYVFAIDKSLSNGSHIIAVKALDNQGNTADTSVLINYNDQLSD